MWRSLSCSIFCTLRFLRVHVVHINVNNYVEQIPFEELVVAQLNRFSKDFINFVGWGETEHLVRWPLIDHLYQSRMIEGECGAVDEMRIGRGNRSTRRKPAPVPLRPPQILHDLAWARIRASEVGSLRLDAWRGQPVRLLGLSDYGWMRNVACMTENLLWSNGSLAPEIACRNR
jgi:hypothetical protein